MGSLTPLYAEYRRVLRQKGLVGEGRPFIGGRGAHTAPRLMLVGEAPGRLEASARRPFAGPSGRVLDELLHSVGLGRSEVWLTNCLKYRPRDEKGRTTLASREELQEASKWLRREHEVLGRPPMVMMGKHSRRTAEMGFKLPAGLVVGEWFWMGGADGFPMLPLYHPQYAVYQKTNRPVLFEQFKAVRQPPAQPEEKP